MNSRSNLSRNTKALHRRKGLATPYLPQHKHALARATRISPAGCLTRRPRKTDPWGYYKQTLTDM